MDKGIAMVTGLGQTKGRRMFLPGCLLAVAGMCQANPALICPAPDTPPGELPPCGAQTPLGPVREPDLDTGISNPVHRLSGEKYLQAIDLPESLDKRQPGFRRYYRSGSAYAGPWGDGWHTDYDARLQREGTGWRLHLADGRTVYFDANGQARQALTGYVMSAARWRAQESRQRPLAQGGRPPPLAPGSTHLWLSPEGQRLAFDQAGRLIAWVHPGQATTHIQYGRTPETQGLITQIRRGPVVLQLGYRAIMGRRLLHTLQTPRGQFEYHYAPAPITPPVAPAQAVESLPAPLVPTDHAGTGTSAQSVVMHLQRVRRPDGMQRHYHYEAAHQGGHVRAITGISLATPQGRRWRARSWSYDALGRVTRAVSGPHSQAPNALAIKETLARARQAEGSVRRDAAGRLSALAGLEIHRHPSGQIRTLIQHEGLWPGLQLHYNPQGMLDSWFSTLGGHTQWLFDAKGRPQGLRQVHGGGQRWQLDAVGRPVQIHYAAPDTPGVSVQLQWRGRQLRRLDHPAEREQRTYNDKGQLVARYLRRPHPTGTSSWQDRFDYNPAGQRVRHHLPEGGALHYRWLANGHLAALTWQSADGRLHPVIDTVAGLAGYRYGNGLQLQAQADARGRTQALLLTLGNQLRWAERRWHDKRGRVSRWQQGVPGAWHIQMFHYDAADRMTGSHTQTPAQPPATDWWAWANDGRLLAHRRLSGPDAPPPDALPAIRRSAAGLPMQLETTVLRYQAQQRLSQVLLPNDPMIRYTYNARGQQIRQQSGMHTIDRQFLENRLVARRIQIPGEAGRPARIRHERYLYAQEAPVGMLQTDEDGHTRLFYVHANLLGAPVLMTDQTASVRWAARYDVLGRAERIAGDLNLPLRLPGQDEDPFTHWHDNGFRTYLPQRGQYLEPDPLGPVPGQQALGYAAQQAMRFRDPLGLILLAFDGTRYGQANQSNVWKLAQSYQDGPRYYHAGPGNNAYLDWDAITAASSGQILRNQWQSLMNALQRAQGSSEPVPIDILGYSRGAALARDMANRIAHQTRNGWFSYDDPLRGTIGLCVDLRFLGLFDTVAQFGLLGAANAGYDLSINNAWSWVAHAVALHELRSLFPLVSAGASGSSNTVEAPFIGAHADIGGGMILDDQGQAMADGDLPDVALNWMRWQALAAMVPLDDLSADDQHVTRPWLHDERIPGARVLGGDRALQDTHGQTLGPQGDDARLGTSQRALFESFIQRTGSWQINAGDRVGVVDMAGYGAWLESALGLAGMGTIPRPP
ncbi:phospholipase effector Tle1 domain-containing protein [Castellaniella sp.]|uniref:phospholipase effector Tle1 domain-containing protein n=1 Tax=Castellaniella sp. TaxID=1955812 RepID=UPI003C742EA9